MQTGHEFIPHDTEGMYKHLHLIFYPEDEEIIKVFKQNPQPLPHLTHVFTYQLISTYCRNLRE